MILNSLAFIKGKWSSYLYLIWSRHSGKPQISVSVLHTLPPRLHHILCLKLFPSNRKERHSEVLLPCPTWFFPPSTPAVSSPWRHQIVSLLSHWLLFSFVLSSSSVILKLWLSHPGSFWNIDILGYTKTNLNHNPWRVEPGYHIFRKLIRWFRYSVKIKNLCFKYCPQGSATGPLSFLQYTCTNSPNLVV